MLETVRFKAAVPETVRFSARLLVDVKVLPRLERSLSWRRPVDDSRPDLVRRTGERDPLSLVAVATEAVKDADGDGECRDLELEELPMKPIADCAVRSSIDGRPALVRVPDVGDGNFVLTSSIS